VLLDDLLDSRVLVARRNNELARRRDRALVVRDRELDPAAAGGIVALTGEWDGLVGPDPTGLLERDPTLIVRLESLFVAVGSGKTGAGVCRHKLRILPGR
jgi:hypothetical protein